MSSSTPNRGPSPSDNRENKKPFHHGNLRKELLDAAEIELERSGYEALSLRRLAETLGVSRSAPYRHFKNRDAMMKALAERWTVAMNEKYIAIQGLDISPQERLKQACIAYQESAKHAPQLYRLIFASPHFSETKTVRDVQTSSQLARFREIVAGASSDTKDENINEAVMLIGCVLHGYAMLRISGQLDEMLMTSVIERAVMTIV